MATKIRKRKRDGVEYGNWCVPLDDGKLLNLGTKDARLANKRAALALQGRWPEDVAGDAARAAEPATEVQTEEVQQEDAGAQKAVLAANPAPVSPAPSGGTGPADPVASAADAVAAASAAAADVAGPDVAQPEPARSEMAAELEKVLAGLGGGAASGVELADLVAGLHVGGAYAIANLVAKKMKPPRVVPDIDDKNILVHAAAAAWRVELRKWLSGLDTVEPWHVLVGVTLAAPAFALLGSKPMENKAEGVEEGKPSESPQG